ncbi:MAG: hypothetical protein A2020_09660 [Lentisphaerae bacterium GWF2_45_14]|nr:MAG: hypothetical protein A2020_09660 [Lentisphaerae bacterium GWF2_45_14]
MSQIDSYQEKVYYKDANVKVTDLRITCNHVTIPIDRIDHYSINFRANNLLFAFTCFMISLIGVYVTVRYLSSWGYLGFILVVLCFVWLRIEYSTYVELFVTTGPRRVKMLDTGMNNRGYLFKIADGLSDALLEKHKEKESVESPGQLSLSDTMKLKKIIMDYDKNE